MPNQNSNVFLFLTAVSAAFLTVAVQSGFDHGWKQPRTIVGFSVAAALVVAGWAWESKLAPIMSPLLTASVSRWTADARSWFALLLLLWTYWAVTSTIAHFRNDEMAAVIQNDIVPFRMALQRWVLPRRLQPDEARAITDHVTKFPVHSVVIEINEGDTEADDYAADIFRALNRGGWTVRTDRARDIPPGLHINQYQTEASSKLSEDARNPSSFTILEQAFEKAGAQVSGKGQQSGGDVLKIRIGPRPTNARSPLQPWTNATMQ